MHPKATIFAIAGPIVIGSGCIIEEGAIVVNRFVQCCCIAGSESQMKRSC